MTDVASLSFNIDSTQAQRAIAVLESLKASSISMSQAASQQNQQTGQLTQTYEQQRNELVKLASATRDYDGSLGGLVTRLERMRGVMRDSQSGMDGYAKSLQAAASAATSFNASLDGLERYVNRARQLNMDVRNLATSFASLTEAARGVSPTGVQTQATLQLLGVRTSDVTSGTQANILLERILEQVRNTNQRLGPEAMGVLTRMTGMDQQQLTAAAYQPYRSDWDRRMDDYRTRQQTQIDTQQQNIQRIRAEMERQRARDADLASQYTINPTPAGRLFGTYAEPFFMPAANTRRERERIAALPDAERAPYQRYGAQLREQFGPSNMLNNMVRNVSSGTWSSNQDEIHLRADMDQDTRGFVYARFREIYREILNHLGQYKPTLTQDSRELSELDRRLLRVGAAGVIAQYGDNSALEYSQAENSAADIGNNDALRRAYRQVWSGPEADRRFANLQANANLRTAYARNPEQRNLDQVSRDRILMAIPEEQRERARFMLERLQQYGGEAAVTALQPGVTAGQIATNPAMNQGQQNANQVEFSQQVADTMQKANEQAEVQIRFQHGLADALERGRGAAEDYTRAWQAWRETLVSTGGDATAAANAAQRALEVTMAQRITQARSGSTDMEREMAQRRRQLNLGYGLRNADPLTRGMESTREDLRQQIEDMIHSGQLPAVGGSSFTDQYGQTQTTFDPNARGEVERRQRDLQLTTAQGGEQQALGIRNAAGDQVRDARELTQIMVRQGVTLEQASRELQRQKEFRDAEIKAAQDASGLELERVETLRQQTAELERQQQIEEQRQQTYQATRQLNEQFNTTQAGLNMPAWMRPITGQLGFLYQGANIIAPPDPGAVQRGADVSLRLQRDLGLTPAGGAFMGGMAIGESGVLPVQQDPSSLQGPGDRGGISLWQFTGPRRDEFLAFCAQNNLSPMSREAGIRFAEHELTSKPGYAPQLAALRNPSLTLAQVTEQAAPYVFGQDPRLMGQLPRRFAYSQSVLAASTNPGDMAGTVTAPASIPGAGTQSDAQITPDEMQSIAIAAMNGQDPPKPAHYPAELWMANKARIITAAMLRWQQMGGQLQGVREQSDIQNAALAQRRGLVGQPGLQELVIPDDPSLAPALNTQRRGILQGEVRGQQRLRQDELETASARTIESMNRLADAWGQGKATADLVTDRLKAEAEARANLIDKTEVEARTLQLFAERTAQATQALAEQTDQRGNQMGVQRALNQRGAFSGVLDQQDTERRAALRQYFDQNPNVEGTQGGQNAIHQLDAMKALDEQTEQMRELRETTQDVEHAFERTFEGVVTGSERGSQALKSLASELESIVMRQLIFKPFENLVNQGMTSLFGGAQPQFSGPSGDGSGNVGGPAQALLSRALYGGGSRDMTGGNPGGDGSPSDGGGLGSVIGGDLRGMGAFRGGGSSPLGGAPAPGLLSQITGHTGGAIGWGVDKIGGQGFYQGGGLIGQAYQGSWLQGEVGSLWGTSGMTASSAAQAAAPLADNVAGPVASASDAGASATGLSGMLGSAGDSIASGASSAWSSFASLFSAQGNIFLGNGPAGRGHAHITDFENSIIEAPTMFRFAKGGRIGMMGEAGAEAVMPLSRGPDGKLGVANIGSTQGAAPTINFHIATPDISGFRASQSQIAARTAAQLNHTVMRSSL